MSNNINKLRKLKRNEVISYCEICGKVFIKEKKHKTQTCNICKKLKSYNEAITEKFMLNENFIIKHSAKNGYSINFMNPKKYLGKNPAIREDEVIKYLKDAISKYTDQLNIIERLKWN